MAPLLYLDFDGVLHPSGVLFGTTGPAFDSQGEASRLFEHCGALARLLETAVDVRIVLSTSWVVAYGIAFAKAQLPSAVQRRVLGATFDPTRDGPGFTSVARGYQVMQDARRRNADRWVAIDDDAVDWPHEFRHRLVVSNPSLGLGDPAVTEALRMALSNLQAGLL